jgi:hypothetical protein
MIFFDTQQLLLCHQCPFQCVANEADSTSDKSGIALDTSLLSAMPLQFIDILHLALVDAPISYSIVVVGGGLMRFL